MLSIKYFLLLFLLLLLLFFINLLIRTHKQLQYITFTIHYR